MKTVEFESGKTIIITDDYEYRLNGRPAKQVGAGIELLSSDGSRGVQRTIKTCDRGRPIKIVYEDWSN